MKIGFYGKGKGSPALKAEMFLTSAEEQFLFDKAPVKTGRVVITRLGETLIMRRANQAEDDTITVFHAPGGAIRVTVSQSRWRLLNLGPLFKQRGRDLPHRMDRHNGVPVIAIKVSDILPIEPAIEDGPRERTVEPLSAPSPVRRPHNHNLAAALELLNEAALAEKAELFIEDGRARARIVTVQVF